VDFYAKRGTSPDVVARQALAAVTRGRRIVPTPRYQVVPHWLLSGGYGGYTATGSAPAR
jgi:hypothetical protein